MIVFVLLFAICERNFLCHTHSRQKSVVSSYRKVAQCLKNSQQNLLHALDILPFIFSNRFKYSNKLSTSVYVFLNSRFGTKYLQSHCTYSCIFILRFARNVYLKMSYVL
jgi:hypothetical protein